ncbi:TPA: restriction endonuclease subunit S [Klebsiella michiganensis]
MTKMSGTFLNSGACDAGPQGEGKESPSNTGRLQTAGRDKYQPYPEYKDSGVEWLGEIPIRWNVTSLKRKCTLVTGLTPPTDNVDNYSDDGFPWVRPEDISETTDKVSASRFVSESAWKSLRKIPAQSTLICCIGTIGKCGYTSDVITTNQQVTAASFTSAYRYYYYHVIASRKQLEDASTGNVLRILNNERLGSLRILSPSAEEAEKIATFLDYETARIDQLIAKQQQLIELLKEKRQAVISHAVTKGLNPNAPMKDSGVEWLGQVPEHWDVWKLNHFCPIITCGVAATPEYVSEGVPFLSAQNIKNHKIDLSKGYKFVSQETHLVLTKYRKPLKGDILLSRVGTIGEPCVVDVDFEFSIFVSLTHIRVHETICANRFLVYLLESQYAKALHTSVTLFGGGVGNLNVNDLREYKLPLPTRSKQLEICDYLDDRLAEFSALVDKAERAIELMQERRTALISAAVTGKIDLRGWQPPKSEEAA